MTPEDADADADADDDDLVTEDKDDGLVTDDLATEDKDDDLKCENPPPLKVESMKIPLKLKPKTVVPPVQPKQLRSKPISKTPPNSMRVFSKIEST